MMPWNKGALSKWSIVGMNHYRQGGERYLFVALVKDESCIVAEGKDENEVWETLQRAAMLKELGR